jgi:serine phosphatase RsbU (regulator of sigma subunit)
MLPYRHLVLSWRQALNAVPLALIVAVPVVDRWTPPTIHLAPVLAVAVTLTAMFSSARRTALTGALAVAALTAAGIERLQLTSERVLVELLSLVLLSVLLVLFCWRRERRDRELARVRLVSEAAQRVVLRPFPERAGPVSAASAYRAAEADTHIGGDFYGLARTGNSTRVIIGDVRGKGLASISETAVVLEAFRAAARDQLPLPEMVRYMEKSALWGLAEFSADEADVGERFVTLAVVDIPDDEPVLRLVSCGHPPPIRLRRGTATPLAVSDPAPPLGLSAMSGDQCEPQTFPFAPGDVLLLYTDGVTEARDARGTFYPLAQRAAAWAGQGPTRLLANIEADLREYRPPDALADDMAMVALRREGPDPPGRGHSRGDGSLHAMIRPHLGDRQPTASVFGPPRLGLSRWSRCLAIPFRR